MHQLISDAIYGFQQVGELLVVKFPTQPGPETGILEQMKIVSEGQVGNGLDALPLVRGDPRPQLIYVEGFESTPEAVLCLLYQNERFCERSKLGREIGRRQDPRNVTPILIVDKHEPVVLDRRDLVEKQRVVIDPATNPETGAVTALGDFSLLRAVSRNPEQHHG